MDSFELARVNHFTLAKHHLTPDTKSGDLVRITGDVGGLHATNVTTPYLSLLARTRTFRREDLDGDLYERRTLAKLRCVRNTIYVHPLQAVPFVFRATVDSVIRGTKRFMQGRGISPEQFKRLSEAVVAILREASRDHSGDMTASAIKAALATTQMKAIRLDVSAVLNLMCDQGVLLRTRPEKSWRDRRQHYALFADYVPSVDLDAMDEQDAIRHLVRHYLAAFGPATETDIVWWTGLGKRKVKTALTDLADQTAQITIAGLDDTFTVLCSELDRLHATTVPAQPVVNLLPVLDAYMMGYKDRARYLDACDQDLVFDRSGNGTSTIMVSGRAAGVWDTGDDKAPMVKLFLFRAAKREVRDAIETEAQKLGRFFFDQETDVRWCTSMVPLTERTAGSMMSPLKVCPLQDGPG